ncbi:MAG: extracellular solute-binding protein [Salibaculum sp.]|uniref:extracellular solute-binding protein n=1 Tax=Salibaculum sp. TaxID=2855480 RepID=UPI002870B36E|nr:extracellular solute-binding protein [Salibaculum sp.]MDR9427339.1 extracellular solute-binding protein [Salibaculum sp.]MDR9483043.1 extracellular solute-binding protein [Salibaculum sp.]
MRPEFFPRRGRIAAIVATALMVAGAAQAEPKHGIAMYGDPDLPPDFAHLPYANPDAPRGGEMVTANIGNFDSLNPFVRKGAVPWQLRFLMGESLMARSLDEPFSLYGLLAESVETGPNREWVEFTLRPEAEFSDGSPVTIEDVMWSYETLGTKGHGRYAGFWSKVAAMEQTGPRSVRFTFDTEDRELALLAGMRPILQKAQYEGVDFAETDGFEHIPVTSSPYLVGDHEQGRYVEFTRNPDYWGDGVVPFRNGTHNLDTLRIEYFGDATAAFEAFKVGTVNFNREFNVAKWDSQYDFTAVKTGDVVRNVLPHERPSGMTGFVMNTRSPQFADLRVRDAMLHAFNFEFINEALTGGAQPRITSYFANSPLAMRPGPAEGRVRDFLEPYADQIPEDALTGYALPASDGTERNRAGITAALDLMEQAGWTVQDGVMADAQGRPFTFEIVLQSGSDETQTIIDIYVQAIDRLGIAPTVTVIDSAQYRERLDAYDFDMTYFRRGLSLSPGNEQSLYWGSDRVDEPGGRNLMGVESAAVDAMIDRLLTSESQQDFLAATRALDRLLTTGRYAIPIYQWNVTRIAHDKSLHYPETMPIFGDWPGWQPDVWWWDAEE